MRICLNNINCDIGLVSRQRMEPRFEDVGILFIFFQKFTKILVIGL